MQARRHLSISKGGLGMLVKRHHEITELAVGEGAVGIHACSLQDLCVDLAQAGLQVIQQHLDGRNLQGMKLLSRLRMA